MKILFAKIFKGVAFIVISLPMSVQMGIGNLLGILWFDIFRIRRKVIFENLDRAFPEKTQEEKIKIARESCCNLGKTLIECARLPFVTPERYKKHFTLHGGEHIQRAYEKNKGVCLLTMHLGNGDWAVAGLALNGFQFYLISKEFKIKWINDLWFNMRRRIGTEFISPRNSSFQILKSLKKNKGVIFVMDQFMGPPIGIKTTFFGHETGTAMGLAVITQKSHTPIIPIYTIRRPDGHTDIFVEPEMPFVQQENSEIAIQEMTQKFNDFIEKSIQKCPGQWMWVHRRWKKFVVT